MAPRIGFTLDVLRRLQTSACASDTRVVWKKDERLTVGLWRDGRLIVQFGPLCGVREPRLIALQLNLLADEYERDNAGEREEEVDLR